MDLEQRGINLGLWLLILVLCLFYRSALADDGFYTHLPNLSAPLTIATASPTNWPNFSYHNNKQEVLQRSELILAQASDVGKRGGSVSTEAITVIFPDIGEPFRSIFSKIIDGIDEQAKAKIRNIAIPANMEVSELNNMLRRTGTKVVIALSQRGFKMAAGLDRDYSVVIGGVLSVPEPEHNQYTVISLTPDPALLFSQLRNLIPGIKRVLVVYNPSNNDWLIKLARNAAKAQGLELITYEARDLAAAARQYEAAFASADNRFDSLWLPQDGTTVEESTILPLVLKESWNRSVPIFSSNFLHVKKGALFALYPNNSDMGRNLAASAMSMLAGEAPKRGVVPLKDVLTAFNVRTATHIGLNIGAQRQRSFDSIFPEQ